MKTPINLNIHRLNAWSDFNIYLVDFDRARFWVFADHVYAELNKLEPGESIDIIKEVHPDSIDKFIKTCCMFICEGHPEFEFTHDYKILKRHELEPISRANSRNAQAKKYHRGHRIQA